MSQSQNSEELSRLAAEMRVFNQSHSHLLEQNQRLMESNAELQKQVLQLTKDVQEMKLQQTRTLNHMPAAPASAFSAPAIVMPTLATPTRAANRGFVSTTERGIKNVTLPMTTPGLSPFTGTPTKPLGTAKPSKVSSQPQGMVKQDTSDRQKLAMMAAAPPVMASGLSPFIGTPTKPLGTAEPSKVSPKPQGMVKQDTSVRQRLAMMPASAATGGGSSVSVPTNAASKPKTQKDVQEMKLQQTRTLNQTPAAPAATFPAPAIVMPTLATPAHADSRGFVSTTERGIKNVTLPMTTPGLSPFTGTPTMLLGTAKPNKVSPKPQGMVKQDTSDRQKLAMMAAAPPMMASGLSPFAGTPTKPLGTAEPSKVSPKPQGMVKQDTSVRQRLGMMPASAATGGGSSVSVPTTAASKPKTQKDLQEMKLQQTRTLNQTPAAPAATFPAPAIVMPTLATPTHADNRGFVSTTERGIKNVTPPMTTPGLSPFTGTPTMLLGTAKPSKVSSKPQGMVKQDTCNRQRLAMMAAAQPLSALGLSPFAETPSKPLGTAKPSNVSSQPQRMIKQDTSERQRFAMMAAAAATEGSFPAFLPVTTASQPKTQLTGFTPSPATSTTKPSQTFSNISFLPSSVNPPPSFAKPVTSSSANLCRPAPSMSIIPTAGFFKLAPPTKATLQPPAGESPAVFSKPNLTQDARSSSPMYPGFYTSQKGLPGTLLEVDQTVPSSRRLGQSPLAKGAVLPKTANTTKSVSFKAEVEASDKPFSFPNAGAPVFGGSASRGNDKNDDSHGRDEAYDPHYEPIVTLPEIGSISTGEEDEEEMFRLRAKLFRFDREVKAWKERGVGDIKILRNPKTGSARILMRRDQILKLCANHWITADMVLKPMMASETAWIWFAVDFSEEEARNEQLAVKFKHAEDSKRFKEAFLEAQKLLGVEEKEKEEEKKEEKEFVSKALTNLKTKFASKPGSWDCIACYSNSPAESTSCLACEGPTSGAKAVTSSTVKGATAPDSCSALRAKFGKKPGSWDCNTCYSNNAAESSACAACTAPKPGSPPKPFTGAGASVGAVGGASAVSSRFNFGTYPSRACTGFGFGNDRTSGTQSITRSGAAFKGAAGFNLSGESSASKGSIPNSNTTGFNFSSPASTRFSFGSKKDNTSKLKENIVSTKSSATGFMFGGSNARLSTSFSSSAGAIGDAVPLGFQFRQKQPGASGFTFGARPSNASAGFFFGSKKNNTPKPRENSVSTKAPPIGFMFGGSNARPSTSSSSSAGAIGDAVPLGFHFRQKQPGASGFTFGARPSNASAGFFFGSKKDNTRKLRENSVSTKAPPTGFFHEADAIKAAPSTSSCATIIDGTLVTDKVTFGTHMPQFSPGGAGKEKPPSDARFSFSLTPSIPTAVEGKEEYPFSSALKAVSSDTQSSTPGKPALSFNNLVMSQSASFTFSFRMDLHKVTAKSPVKSPGVGRSPKTSFSRGGRMLSGGSIDEDMEQGDDMYFKPTFLMPDDYEVTSGEEGEEVKFSHRAKLYRYDGESKQWKERGVGDIKVLYSSEDHAYRIVMRRERVFKVCANHYLNPSIELRPNAGSDRSWVWSAMDASEGKVQNEQLAVKFRVVDTAKKFEEVVNKAKEDLAKDGGMENKNNSTVGGEVNPEEERDIHFQPIVKLPDNVDLVTGEEQEVAVFVGLGKLYRFDGGARQWKERGVGDIKIMKEEETDVYRIVMRRDQIHKVCANHYITSFMALHPMSGSDRAWVWHAMDAADGEPTSEQLAIKFKDPSIAASFKEKFEQAQAKIRLREAGDDWGQKALKEDGDRTASSSTGHAGDGVAKTTPSSQDSKSEEPVIRSCDPNLSSVLAEAIKASSESSAASSVVQAIGGEVNPEEERDIHFQPIIKLPGNVDLVTGEEQEVAAFVGRGKLYRFDGRARQWKERGVGDIKIMKEEDTDVYRIVMRRDQTHKVCANHYITSSMALHLMSSSDRAWVWHAMDAADGEPTSEQLAIKFKDPSIASSFKEKFEEAQAKIRLRECSLEIPQQFYQ